MCRPSTLLLTALLTLCTNAAAAKDITVVNFGGANGAAQKIAFVEPFQNQGNQRVISLEYDGDQTKVKQMVGAGNVSWDVVEVESGDLGPGCEQGLYEKLDFSKIGKRSDFLPEAIHPCGVGVFIWSTVLAYNPAKLKGAPLGWPDFWNVAKFPGQRGMRKGARYNLEFALMADGVPALLVYDVLATPDGVNRAFRKLTQLKPYIKWWEGGAQPPQMLSSGEVVMSTAYSGRIDAAQREGRKLSITWSGSIYDLDYWAIPRGSPNRAIGEQFIAYASSEPAQAEYARNIAYGPVNTHALERLDAKTLANLPIAPYNAKNAVQNNVQFWARQGPTLEQRFKEWLAN